MDSSTPLEESCKKVNDFFGLYHKDKKINFRTTEGPTDIDDFESPVNIHSEDLIKLYQWIFENIYIIVSNNEGAKHVSELLNSLELERQEPFIDLDDSFVDREWFDRVYRLLNDFFDIFLRNIFQRNDDPWKKNIMNYYYARELLFEILRYLLYPEQAIGWVPSDKMKDYVRNLRLNCFLYLQNAITYLSAPIWFDMPLKIREEHEKWIEIVVQFYFLENQILLKGYSDLSKSDIEKMKTWSLTKHDETDRKLAYSIGFVVDCFNTAYGIPTQKIIQRPRVLHEGDCIVDLCVHFIENIRINSKIKTNALSWRHWDNSITSCYEMIENILIDDTEKFHKISKQTRQLVCLLLDCVEIHEKMNNIFPTEKYPRDNVDFFLEENLDDNDFYHISISILEKLLIKEEDKTHPGYKDASEILEILSYFRKTSFRSLSFFFMNLDNEFIFTSDQKKFHEEWKQKKLLPLLERAQPIIKKDTINNVAKNISRLTKIFAPKKPTFPPDENMED